MPNNPTKKRAEVDLFPLFIHLTKKRLLSTLYVKRLADDDGMAGDGMPDDGIVSSEESCVRKSFAVT